MRFLDQNHFPEGNMSGFNPEVLFAQICDLCQRMSAEDVKVAILRQLPLGSQVYIEVGHKRMPGPSAGDMPHVRHRHGMGADVGTRVRDVYYSSRKEGEIAQGFVIALNRASPNSIVYAFIAVPD